MPFLTILLKILMVAIPGASSSVDSRPRCDSGVVAETVTGYFAARDCGECVLVARPCVPSLVVWLVVWLAACLGVGRVVFVYVSVCGSGRDCGGIPSLHPFLFIPLTTTPPFLSRIVVHPLLRPIPLILVMPPVTPALATATAASHRECDSKESRFRTSKG